MSEPITPALTQGLTREHVALIEAAADGCLGDDYYIVDALTFAGHDMGRQGMLAARYRDLAARIAGVIAQPFGFTQEDVDALRAAAFDAWGIGDTAGDARLLSLADRIAALLPPA